MKRLENKRFAVGRAGHDPATYGLKGRGTKQPPPLDSSDAVTLPIYREPPVAQAQAGSSIRDTGCYRLAARAPTLYWPRLS